MTWEKFEKQIAIVNDDDIFEELTEREKTVVGPEPNHDYTKRKSMIFRKLKSNC